MTTPTTTPPPLRARNPSPIGPVPLLRPALMGAPSLAPGRGLCLSSCETLTYAHRSHRAAEKFGDYPGLTRRLQPFIAVCMAIPLQQDFHRRKSRSSSVVMKRTLRVTHSPCLK